MLEAKNRVNGVKVIKRAERNQKINVKGTVALAGDLFDVESATASMLVKLGVATPKKLDAEAPKPKPKPKTSRGRSKKSSEDDELGI